MVLEVVIEVVMVVVMMVRDDIGNSSIAGRAYHGNQDPR